MAGLVPAIHAATFPEDEGEANLFAFDFDFLKSNRVNARGKRGHDGQTFRSQLVPFGGRVTRQARGSLFLFEGRNG
jgi:hypothetical protein